MQVKAERTQTGGKRGGGGFRWFSVLVNGFRWGGEKELKWAFLLAWNGSAVAGLVGAR